MYDSNCSAIVSHWLSYCLGQVGADDSAILDKIIDSLTSIANSSENQGFINEDTNKISFKVGKIHKGDLEKEDAMKKKTVVLILGAGRVCRPAAEFLASIGSGTSRQWLKTCIPDDFEENNDVQVIVASLYLQDAEEVQLNILSRIEADVMLDILSTVIFLVTPRSSTLISAFIDNINLLGRKPSTAIA